MYNINKPIYRYTISVKAKNINILGSSINTRNFKEEDWLPLSELASSTSYSAEYLSLLARKKKLPARKIKNVWHTTQSALDEYVKRQVVRVQIQNGAPGIVQAPEPLPTEKIIRQEFPTPKSFKDTVFTYEKYDGAQLPELSKKSKYIEPVFSVRILKKITALSLALIIAVVSGLATLERTDPFIATEVRQKVESASNVGKNFLTTLPAALSGQAAASLLGFVDYFFDEVIAGFHNLKEIALNKFFFTLPEWDGVDLAREEPAKTILAKVQPLNLESLKSALKVELEEYVRLQIASLSPPIVYSSLASATPADFQSFKTNEIVPVIYYSITRQSDTDSSRNSINLVNITDGGTFTNATINNSTFSGSSVSATNLGFGLATGTSATTTNFFSTNATFTNLVGVVLGLTDISFTNSTGTNATTTSLFSSVLTANSLRVGGTATSTINSSGDLLVVGSTTLQNFTFNTATGTSATTTNLYFSNNLTGPGSFIVNSSGNVGIGTRSPAAQVDINNTVSGILGLELTSEDNTDEDSGSLLIGAYHSESTRGPKIEFKSSRGSKASPSHQLGTGEDLGKINFFGYGGGSFREGASIIAESAGTWVTNFPGQLSFFTHGNNSSGPSTFAMIIDENQNVGIGTTAPDELLEISSGNNDVNVHLDAFAGANLLIDKGSTSRRAQIIYQTAGSDDWFAGTSDSDAAGDGTEYFVGRTTGGTNAQFWIETNGNVGIGTANPAYALDVAGFINTDQYSGYKQAGNTILYASSTNFSSLGGISAGVALLADGLNNTAFGYQALDSATSTDDNTAFGYQALSAVIEGGKQNTAIGSIVLDVNTTGENNSALGYGALTSNTTGANNTAIGQLAMSTNTTGGANVAVGRGALSSNSASVNNVAVGYNALLSAAPVAGSGANIGIGYAAGDNITTGSFNTIIGYNIDAPSATASNQLNIGNLIFGTGIDGTGTTLSSGNVGIGTTSPYAKLSVEHLSNTGTVIGADALTGFTGNLLDLKVASTTKFSINQDGDFLSSGSTTLQNFTFVNATGTNATTTSFFATTASSSSLYGAALASCTGDNYLTWTGGIFGCDTDETGSAFFAWTPTSYGVSTTTELGFLSGFLSTSSSTIDANLIITGNSTTTNATSTTMAGTIASFYKGVFDFVTATGTTATSTFAGGLTIETSGFVYDFSSNRVGIGTASPTSPLHVSVGGIDVIGLFEGTGGVQARIAVNASTADADAIISFQEAGTSRWSIGNNGDSNANSFVFSSGTGGITSNQRLVITSTGNVGIGTTSPWGLLSVNPSGISGPSFVVGSSTKTNFIVTNGGNVGIGTTSPDTLLHISADAGAVTTLLTLENNDGARIRFENNTNTTDDWLLTANSLGFSISEDGSGTTELIVKSGGGVGIGTTTPFSTLSIEHIAGASPFSIGSSTGSTLFVDADGNVGIGTSSPMSLLTIEKDSSSESPKISISSLGGTIPSVWSFIVNRDTARFTITNELTGAAPFKLDIGAGNNSLFVSGTGIGLNETTPDFALEIATTTTDYFGITNSADGDIFVVNSSGNVGIGTTSPFAKLSVESVAGETPFIIGSSTATSLIVDSNGNVGIGTTTPGVPLEIDTSGVGLRISNTVGGGAAIDLVDFGGQVWRMTGGDLNWKIRDASSGNDRLVVLSSNGNVGVATTTPFSTLSVEHIAGASPFSIGSSTGSTLFIDVDGNVGIGTAAPSEILHVSKAQSTDTIFLVSNTSNNTSARTKYQIQNDETISALANYLPSTHATLPSWLIISNNANDAPLAFRTKNDGGGSATDKMIILGNGNVGIGTSTPTNKLEIYNNMGGGGITLDSQSGSDSKFTLNELSITKWQLGNKGADDSFRIGAGSISDADTDFLITSSGNVGIGTTSPEELLSVAGTIRTEATFPFGLYIDTDATAATNVGGEFSFRFGDGLSGTLVASFGIPFSDGNFVLRTQHSAGELIFRSGNNSEAMRIDENGNVGIGTTSPDFLLHLSKDTIANIAVDSHGASASIGGFFRGRMSRGTVASPTVIVSGDRMGGFLGQGYDGASYITAASIEFSTSGTIASTRVPGEIQFFTATDATPSVKTQRMVIDNAGNVGIGIAAPTSLLHISGSSAVVSIEDTDGLGILIIRNDSATPVANTSLGKINFKGNDDAGNDTTYAQIKGLVTDDTDGSEDGYLSFYTTGAGVLAVERMRIDSSGNVGIGTTSPFAKLSVESVAGETPFIIGSSTATSLIVDSNGNVGIGTESPNILSTAEATVLTLLGSTSNGGSLELAHPNVSGTGVIGKIEFLNLDNGSTAVSRSILSASRDGADDASRLQFFTEATGATVSEKMTILGNGNVGIGTTTPQGFLHVYGAGRSKFDFHSTTDTTGTRTAANFIHSTTQNMVDGFGVNMIFSIQDGTSGLNDIGYVQAVRDGADNSGSIEFVPRNAGVYQTGALWIDKTGNIGIGTTSPWAQLSVEGQGSKPEFLVTGTDLTPDFIIDSFGNVGIGTTAPAALLDVDNSSSSGFGIDDFHVLTASGSAFANSNEITLITGDVTGNRTVSGTAGKGGDMIITSGDGGDASEGASASGQGGDILITTGDAGVASSVSGGRGGDFIILLGLGSQGTRGGNVGIGDTTPDSALDIVRTTSANDVLQLQDSSGTCEAQPTTGGLTWSCSSDISLKFDWDTPKDRLAWFTGIKLESYYVKKTGEFVPVGVIAQHIQDDYPELVSVGDDGLLTVSEPTPWDFVSAIQELDLKLESITSTTVSGSSPKASAFATSFFENIFTRITTWLADASNGIGDFFAKAISTEIVYTKELCIEDICITKTELVVLLGLANTSPSSSGDAGSRTTAEPIEVVTEEPTVTSEQVPVPDSTASSTEPTLTTESEPEPELDPVLEPTPDEPPVESTVEPETTSTSTPEIIEQASDPLEGSELSPEFPADGEEPVVSESLVVVSEVELQSSPSPTPEAMAGEVEPTPEPEAVN